MASRFEFYFEHVALHATLVMKDDVVLDIQPDFVDLRSKWVVMPADAARPILPVVPALYQC